MKPATQPLIVKVLTPAQLREVRLKSALHAQKHLTAQQVHRQIRMNGSVPSPNPFYTGRKTEEECFQLLNSKT